jgi:hypothetical protein
MTVCLNWHPVVRRGEIFDVVMLTAVWMHLDEHQRRHAMRSVASVVRTRGLMILSLRHGPVPPGRRMFEVSAKKRQNSRGLKVRHWR